MRVGFEGLRYTSFMMTLFLPVYLMRQKSVRTGCYEPMDELHIQPAMQTVLGWSQTMERGLIRLGVNLPFGVNRLLLAKKPS